MGKKVRAETGGSMRDLEPKMKSVHKALAMPVCLLEPLADKNPLSLEMDDLFIFLVQMRKGSLLSGRLRW